MKEEVFNEDDGEIIGTAPVYTLFEKVVETNGDFLWPKQFRSDDGKPFGFNYKELARKKAKYIDCTNRSLYLAKRTNEVDEIKRLNSKSKKEKLTLVDKKTS